MFRVLILFMSLRLLVVGDAFVVRPGQSLTFSQTRTQSSPSVSLTATKTIQKASRFVIRQTSRIPWRKQKTSKVQDVDNARQIVEEHFPGALTSRTVLQKVACTIESYGFTSANTLYAQSVCPDEINHRPHDSLPNLLAEHLGEVFHLGGLAGIPFTGKTGFAAFSHHVPDDDGNLFILLAPHIGLSGSLQLGKYCRDGQGKKEGAACGAAVGALQHVMCCDEPLADLISNEQDDFQMSFLIHHMSKVKDEILQKETENERQAALAFQTHAIGKTMLDSIRTMDFGGRNSKLLILSGIQINMPLRDGAEDYFLPLTFELYTKSNETVDLLSETFGNY